MSITGFTFSVRRSAGTTYRGWVPKPPERLLGFEPGSFRFLLQRLNLLGHSPVFLLDIKIKNLHQKQNFKLTQSEKTTEVT